MHLRSVFLILLAYISLALSLTPADASKAPLPADFDQQNREPPQTYVLSRWKLSATGDDGRLPLGMIRYVKSALSATFTPMTGDVAVDEDEKFRVGIFKGSHWIGSVRTGKIFQPNNLGTITLHVDEKAEIFHIEYDSVEWVKEGEKPETEIIIIRPFLGAQPVLNKPVVLTAEGKMAPPKNEEKTFLQKYWWLLVAGALFLAAAPGEGGK
ncbi:hypothetical protein AA313_de0207836 [Arthrobotrys entomopaga]|nr:hypothetical protein AA313_de0207836 [Arthrobotrys entomopaga]